MKIAVLKEARGRDALRRDPGNREEVRRAWRRGRGRKRRRRRRLDRRRRLRSRGSEHRQPRRGAQGRGHHPCVNGPDPRALSGAEKGALLVGALDPARRREAIDGYAAAGLEALAMEWMPRITRAQSMDILSSQSNLAGYKAVVDAADAYGRAFPMMMTAAGTVSPAKVFVMGVGVAGPAGDRDRQAPGRAGQRDRRALGDEGADPCRSAPSRSSSRTSPGSKARARAATRRKCRDGISEGAGRAGLRPHRQAGHRHHHRADPRPARRRG